MKAREWVAIGVGAGLLYWMAKRQPSALSGLDDLADLGKKLAKPKPKRAAKGREEPASADKPVIPFLATIEKEKSSTAAVKLILDAYIYNCLTSIDNVNRQIFASKGMYIDGLVQGGYPELEGHVEVVHRALGEILWDIATMLRVDIPPMCGKIFGDSSPVRVAWEPSLTMWNSLFEGDRGLGNMLVTPMIEIAQDGWKELLGKVNATRAALSGDWYSLAWFYERLLTGGGSWLKPTTSWIIEVLQSGSASIWARGKTMSLLNFVRKGSQKGYGLDNYMKTRKAACAKRKYPCPTCYSRQNLSGDVEASLEAIYCAVIPERCGQAPKAQPPAGGGAPNTLPAEGGPFYAVSCCGARGIEPPKKDETVKTCRTRDGTSFSPCTLYDCKDARGNKGRWMVDGSGIVRWAKVDPWLCL